MCPGGGWPVKFSATQAFQHRVIESTENKAVFFVFCPRMGCGKGVRHLLTRRLCQIKTLAVFQLFRVQAHI